MFIPSDIKNLHKHTHFVFKTKGLRGYLLYNTARLQIFIQKTTLLNPKMFEATRRILSKVKKNTDAKLAFKHIQLSFSKKPLQTRMGKGKGKPFNKWNLPIRKGMPIISIYNWFVWEKFLSLFERVKRKFHNKLKFKLNIQKQSEYDDNTNYKWFIKEH